MAIGGDYVVHIVEMLVNGWSVVLCCVVLCSSPHNTDVLVSKSKRGRERVYV